MTEESKGLFFNSLKMNGKEVRDNRAKQLAMGAEMAYRAEVDQLMFNLNTKLMEQENSLDLSPDNSFSFIKLSDFDPKVFASKDLTMAMEIRNIAVKLLRGIERYEELFGEAYNIKEEDRKKVVELAKY